MTFTAAEAEVILREEWDDAESVGGFLNDCDRTVARNQMSQIWGDDIKGFKLIGQTMWSDFEEGGESSLWVKEDDDTLWTFDEGLTVYGSFGSDFRSEVYPADLAQWLDTVRSNILHAENFVGM